MTAIHSVGSCTLRSASVQDCIMTSSSLRVEEEERVMGKTRELN